MGPYDFILTTFVLGHAVVPVLAITASLAFAGRMLILNKPYVNIYEHGYSTRFYLTVNTGMLILRNMMFYWQYRK